MRWFVEVSRVGESNLAEKYCVDAKQWQAALQEARKLRGDTGALSQFSIELLDNGYRAVDPALKLRYLVNQAPDDAGLSEQPNAVASGASAASGAAVVEGGNNHRVADVVRASMPPASLAPSAAGASLVPRPGSASAPRPTSVNPARPSNAAPRLQQMVVPDDPVPPAPPAPGASFTLVAPVAVAVAPAAEALLSFEVVRERAEEPRPDSPITYRELAFAVAPGATRSQVEALLQDRYRAARATIEDRPAGKFVQIAVFDHVFKRRPERPPLGTFAWKDWRGDPVLAFPGFGEAPLGPMSQVPPAPPSLVPPANGAQRPSAPPAASLSLMPLPAALVPSAPPAVAFPPTEPPAVSLAPSPMVTLSAAPSTPAAPAEPPLTAPPLTAPPLVAAPVPAPVIAAPVPAPVIAAPVIAEPVVAAPAPAPVVAEPVAVAPLAAAAAPVAAAPVAAAPAAASGFELNFESTPFNAAPAAPKSSPDKERVSRPRLAIGRRRAAGEDLISELFDFMHELHFQPDFAAGAEFVLSVVNEMLPCEGVLIHVFDINTGHFVIVRAKGPNARSVLLQRMSDQDPFVRAVMRSPRSVSVPNAANDARFQGSRWQAVGVAPKAALAGGAQQGGRYLGLIELVNPMGDTPFHADEVNALDYICAQFAEFLSTKPLVLAADVVLARL